MENLNLPVMKKPLPAAKRLSMEDYLRFVSLHLRYTLERKNNRRQKRLSAVTRPFSLE